MPDMPINEFKQSLSEDATSYGLFVNLADPVAAEIVAHAGFDWITIDTEHAPNDIRTVLAQLQAVSAAPCEVMVRPWEGTRSLIKRILDLGAQTILVPMVDTAEQAAELVVSMRYPTAGKRGAAGARASGWGRIEGYFTKANEQVCLIVQIETAEGLANLESICAVEGVDAVFIGPTDLGASLGHIGDLAHPETRATVVDAIARINAAGKPAGVFASTPDAVDVYRDAGAKFIALGTDTYLLANITSTLAARGKLNP